MEYALVVIMIGLAIGLLPALAWAEYCNNKTFSDRTKVLKEVFKGVDWREKSALFKNSISYEQHIWRLFLFQGRGNYLKKWYGVDVDVKKD